MCLWVLHYLLQYLLREVHPKHQNPISTFQNRTHSISLASHIIVHSQVARHLPSPAAVTQLSRNPLICLETKALQDGPQNDQYHTTNKSNCQERNGNVGCRSLTALDLETLWVCVDRSHASRASSWVGNANNGCRRYNCRKE